MKSTPRSPRPIAPRAIRSEEHTSELQSLTNLVCRLLLEKKNAVAVPREGGHHPVRVLVRRATRHFRALPYGLGRRDLRGASATVEHCDGSSVHAAGTRLCMRAPRPASYAGCASLLSMRSSSSWQVTSRHSRTSAIYPSATSRLCSSLPPMRSDSSFFFF